MNRVFRPWMLFLTGAAATAMVWALLPSDPEDRTGSTPTKPDSRRPAWTPDSLRLALEALATAQTDEARIEAAIRLGRIPVSEVEAALEALPLTDGGELSLACRTLLIRWGASDGPAAAAWAWKKFYRGGHWHAAFREVGASWAWHDPAGLQRWAMESPRVPIGDPVNADRLAAESAVPILDTPDIGRIIDWLFPEKPGLAIELKQTVGGISSDDYKLAESLGTVAKVREALSGCKDLDKLESGRITGDQMIAWSLLQRWKNLDPEDFSRSPHAKLLATMDTSTLNQNAKLFLAAPTDSREATADQFVANVPENQRVIQRHLLAREWAAASPAAAAAWVEKLPDAPVYAGSLASGGFPEHPAETMAWVGSLPEPQRTQAVVAGFEAWKKSHPDDTPDMSGWTAGQVDAWMDLEAVGK